MINSSSNKDTSLRHCNAQSERHLHMYLKNIFWAILKGHTMSNTQNNQQGNSNEAPKTVTPDEAKPGAQQNQGDSKPDTDKPAQQK